MSDSNWDSFSEQPVKRVIPVWVKFFIGCGVVAFVLLGSCVGFTYWAASTGKMTKFFAEKVTAALEKPWGMLLAVTDAIQTDEDAIKLYRDNPALVNDYPTETDFLKKIAVWRTKVADLPRTPPSFALLDKNDFHINSGKSIGRNRRKLFEISYKISDEDRIQLCWEDDKLVEFRFSEL
ncbi:MAG: hypothetical protein LBH03_06720 [Holophagales bacterium]|jgi:hypothetical protein|nr:hypothetical protein [Holophagales bacterium]